MSQHTKKEKVVYGHHQPHGASLRGYTIGFTASIILTIWSYLLATRHRFTGWTVVVGLLTFAVIQFYVQVYYFLHLGSETRPRWKRLLLYAMLGVVLIVIIGSLWIMYNLNYHMSHQQMQQYLEKQDGGI